MGYMSAIGMAEHSDNLDQALGWHFSGNCFPPIPSDMIPVAKLAIDFAADDEWDVELELPDCVESPRTATVSKVVNSLRLAAFVDYRYQQRMAEEYGELMDQDDLEDSDF